MYTGIDTGDIVRFNLKDKSAKDWEHIFNFYGKPCPHEHMQEKCGRPLAMEFDSKGDLIFCDAFLGLLKLDFKKQEVTNLIPGNHQIAGKTNKLINNFAVSKDGLIYYTVTTTSMSPTEALLGMFMACVPDGRIMIYDSKKKSTSVLVENVGAANGIILAPDESFLLYSEFSQAKVWKLHLKGPKAGEEELFALTPGLPDNITPNGKGGFLVAIYMPLPANQFDPIVDFLNVYPTISRFFLRFFYNVKALIHAFNDYVVHLDVLDAFLYWMYNPKLAKDAAPDLGLFVEYDSDGNVLQSWHGTKIGKISEARLYDGNLYLGSFANPFVGVVKYAD